VKLLQLSGLWATTNYFSLPWWQRVRCSIFLRFGISKLTMSFLRCSLFGIYWPHSKIKPASIVLIMKFQDLQSVAYIQPIVHTLRSCKMHLLTYLDWLNLPINKIIQMSCTIGNIINITRCSKFMTAGIPIVCVMSQLIITS